MVGIRLECFNNKCQIELAEMKMECISFLFLSFWAKEKGFIRTHTFFSSFIFTSRKTFDLIVNDFVNDKMNFSGAFSVM